MAKAKQTSSPADAPAEREVFPQDWGDICGHAGIIRRLRSLAAAERLPHALLLSGPEGAGALPQQANAGAE